MRNDPYLSMYPDGKDYVHRMYIGMSNGLCRIMAAFRYNRLDMGVRI